MAYNFLVFAELDWHRQIRSDSVIADNTNKVTCQTPSMFRHIRWFRMQTSPILQQHPPYSPVSQPFQPRIFGLPARQIIPGVNFVYPPNTFVAESYTSFKFGIYPGTPNCAFINFRPSNSTHQ